MGGVVPLSEHEQRQLDQIEQALYSEDPKFVHAVRSRDPRVHYRRRALRALIGFVLGVGLLLAGVISQHPWVGVVGFAVMLASTMWALTSWRHMTGPAMAGVARPRRDKRRRRRARGGPGMMERLEERWPGRRILAVAARQALSGRPDMPSRRQVRTRSGASTDAGNSHARQRPRRPAHPAIPCRTCATSARRDPAGDGHRA
jgi:hypothetical protein